MVWDNSARLLLVCGNCDLIQGSCACGYKKIFVVDIRGDDRNMEKFYLFVAELIVRSLIEMNVHNVLITKIENDHGHTSIYLTKWVSSSNYVSSVDLAAGIDILYTLGFWMLCALFLNVSYLFVHLNYKYD